MKLNYENRFYYIEKKYYSCQKNEFQKFYLWYQSVFIILQKFIFLFYQHPVFLVLSFSKTCSVIRNISSKIQHPFFQLYYNKFFGH